MLVLVAGLFLLPSVRARRLVSRAEQAINERRTEEAILLLNQAQHLDEQSSGAEFLLARAARLQGRFADAERHLARAGRLGYDEEWLQRERWLAMAQAGQMSEATERLHILLQDPRGDAPYICEAYVEGYFATQRFDQGLELVDAWAADYPTDPQPFVYRGVFFEHTGNWPDAAGEYRRAQQMAPERVDIALRLGNLLVQLHEYEEAAICFKRCREDLQGDPEVEIGWAKCLLGFGDNARARTVLEDLLESQPKYEDAWLAMAQIDWADGRNEQAEVWLQQYCMRRSTDVEARYLYAQILQALDHQEEAAAHFEFVAEAREKMSEIEPLLSEVRQDPENADLRYQVGVRLLQYDVPEHGAEWLRSALDIQPDHGRAHAGLAEYYAAAGQHDLAEHHRRLAEASNSTANPTPDRDPPRDPEHPTAENRT